MRRLITAIISLLLLSLFGCTSPMVIKVDAIAAPEPITATRYVILSGMQDVSEDDLYFREFSHYFRVALNRQGYRETSLQDAELAIYLSYGINPGRTVSYTTSHPVYEWVGGETVVYSETKDEPAGRTKTVGEVWIPSRRQVVGMDVSTHEYTVITGFAILEAKPNKETDNPQALKTLWKTTINSSGESIDLRALMPAMAIAAEPYLGADTGQIKVIKMDHDDARIIQLQQESQP